MVYPNQTGWQPSGHPPPIYVSVRATNGMAIAALIVVFVFYPIGIILGHVARGQIKRTREGGRDWRLPLWSPAICRSPLRLGSLA